MSAFRRNASTSDGLSHYCSACFRKRDAASYRRRREAAGLVVRPERVVPSGSKFCPACEQVLSVDAFQAHKTQSGGYASYCKSCKAGKDEDRRLTRLYGLDRAAVAALRRAQGDRCLLCGAEEPRHVDHDHVSGVTRGLLCFRCNAGLGQFGDLPDLLRAAAEYVQRRGWHRRPVGPGVVQLVPPRGQRAASGVPDLAPLIAAGRRLARVPDRRRRPASVARRLRR